MLVTLRAALEAAEGSRTLRGAAVTYGEEGAVTIDGVPRRAVFEAGSLETSPAATVTVSHDRGAIVGRPQWADSPQALRVEATLPETPRANQALADVSAGLLTGWSVEASIVTAAVVDGVHRIRRAVVQRVSIVDAPAFPSSVIAESAETTPRRRRRVFL